MPNYSYQGSLDGLRVEDNVFISNGPAVYYLDSVPSGVSRMPGEPYELR